MPEKLTIAITGGTGFLGPYVIEAAAARETVQKVDTTQYMLATLVLHAQQQLEGTWKTCGQAVCKYCT